MSHKIITEKDFIIVSSSVKMNMENLVAIFFQSISFVEIDTIFKF